MSELHTLRQLGTVAFDELDEEAGVALMDITQMQHGVVMRGRQVNASANRERTRQRRLARLVVVLGVPLAWFWYRQLTGNPLHLGIPPIRSEERRVGKECRL